MKIGDQALNKKSISLGQALIPVLFLIGALAYNVLSFGDEAISGSNQFILLCGAFVAIAIGMFNRVYFSRILDRISENIKSVSGAIFILLLVGSLVASWLFAGVIPAMLYYGLALINPAIFLPASLVLASIVSVMSGSSWTTSATVGVALIAVGKTLGISEGIVAGAVISGAYFGDKISPLSDTTNLAAAIAGAPLFTHIKYMLYTTVPTVLISLAFFTAISYFQPTTKTEDVTVIMESIKQSFNISPFLFLIPGLILYLIAKNMHPVLALFIGTLAGLFTAFFIQPQIWSVELDNNQLQGFYKYAMNTITIGIEVSSENKILADLFQAGGMAGMLNTVWLILCAAIFGGAMEAIGALEKISAALLTITKTVFGLFASTVASCLAINIVASDQYLAIVVPGKMFQKAFEEKDLAPENLSRTLEDSGTVTSVLVPWNTCGAYQSGVLGVSVYEFLPYAIFNYLSPFMTLLFAAFSIKIRSLKK